MTVQVPRVASCELRIGDISNLIPLFHDPRNGSPETTLTKTKNARQPYIYTPKALYHIAARIPFPAGPRKKTLGEQLSCNGGGGGGGECLSETGILSIRCKQ